MRGAMCRFSPKGAALDADFFAGESVAYGIFEDGFGNLRRQFQVNMTGTVEGDT